MEAFSSLIQQLKLDVEVYHNAQVCGNWLINKQESRKTSFHMVTKGQCRLEVPNHLTTELAPGDLVIFPRLLPHSLRPINPEDGEQQHLPYNEKPSSPATGLLCANVEFQHFGSHFVLDALPKVFIVKASHNTLWSDSLMAMIMQEGMEWSMGSEAVMSRLSELLFIYALRQYLEGNPEKVGILALYTHPRLAKALAAIHEKPDTDWSLEGLAKQVAMSRTKLAQNFKQISGWTVMEYITWWRMQLAWSQLDRGDSVALVAEVVGYRSEAAFSRAFKKRFGITPGKVRSKLSV
ncbi:AraC family transcriptional regulator [Vibrio sp. DW001]|uniref:AraC family transcriptional regulator n=1 Tax=Vibrio sp. DW001 TaxID=2912315 RepID=UPI0023B081A2|nr:AraC family transcriptional regulator [Vibrio sp. DW001]WED27296.1 AraC family transcriptional regulator [Vibrio sp. DW001]